MRQTPNPPGWLEQMQSLVLSAMQPETLLWAGGSFPGSFPAAHRMLAQHAPALLRQLHARDLRRQLCPPGLWLDVWNHRPEGTPAADATAVVMALQQGPAAR